MDVVVMICSILGDFYRNEYCVRIIVKDGKQQNGGSLEHESFVDGEFKINENIPNNSNREKHHKKNNPNKEKDQVV